LNHQNGCGASNLEVSRRVFRASLPHGQEARPGQYRTTRLCRQPAALSGAADDLAEALGKSLLRETAPVAGIMARELEIYEAHG